MVLLMDHKQIQVKILIQSLFGVSRWGHFLSGVVGISSQDKVINTFFPQTAFALEVPMGLVHIHGGITLVSKATLIDKT